MPPTRAFFRDFGGGINNNTPANQIKDSELVEALNVEFDKQNNIRSRLGCSILNYNRNLLTRSEEFDHADWIKGGSGNVSANTTVAPDGAVTADTLNDTSSISGFGVSQTKTFLAADLANKTFVFSLYIKKSTINSLNRTIIGIEFNGSSSIDGYAFVNLFNGDVYSIGSPETPQSFGSIDYGDYWRVYVSVKNTDIANTTLTVYINPTVTEDAGFISQSLGSIISWGSQLERGLKPHKYHKTVAVTGSLSTYNTSTFTSIYQFIKEDGSNGIFATAGNKIYRYDSSTNTLVDATGGLSLPNGTYWQWVTWRDIAIGVNRANTASGFVNPVKITSASGSAVALGGTPPKGLYIEVWNDRIWIVNADDTSSVKCSSLGLPENYTNTGKAGSQAFEFGMEITGIKAYRDRLFVFGKNTIQYIQAGSPNTDLEQYEIKLFSPKVGCVSAYSIQPVLDDLIFLSYYGITSLAAVEQFGDFESSILSKNLEDFDDPEHFSFFGDTCGSVVLSTKSQYILSIPLGVNSIHTDTYSFDFTGIQEKTVGFTQLNSLYLAPCFAEVLLNNKKRLLIGGYADSLDENNSFIYLADEPGIFDDDGINYIKRIRTKAHDLEALTSNKVFYRVFFDFSLFSNEAELILSYRLDEKEELEKSWSVSLTASVVDGAKYDVDKFDVGKFATLSTPFKTIQRRLVGPPGRIGQSLQLGIECTKPNGFILRGYGFDAQLITSRRLTGG